MSAETPSSPPRTQTSGQPHSAHSPEEDPRALAGSVVHALYRVVKGCFLHEDGNQALTPLYEGLIEAVGAFCSRSKAESASVLFASNTVFVNRQMLRASRETYQLALEIGTMLLPCRITEVSLDPTVSASAIAEFGRAVAEAHRERKVNPRFADGGWPHLRTRRVLGLGGGEYVPPVTRVARTYAASIMILRSFYSDLRQSKYELSHSLKRVAQKISGALEDEKRLFISTAATPPSDTDRAGIAVSSAILATQIAAQLTDDRSVLTNLAMAALLYDAPRVCFANAAAGDIRFERSLNEDEEERLPTVSLITLTAVGKLHAPSITRSVLVYEALALRSDATPPYGGARSPHLLSRILHVARGFAEMRVARGAFAPLSIDDAVDVLTSQANDNTARALVKLLVGVLGVFPSGTLVELSTGELAVVTASPKMPIDFARPAVRILYDAGAQLLDAPIDIDLANQFGANQFGANQRAGATQRVIRKAIDATDQQMKQMRAYVMNLSVRREEVSAARVAVTTPPPGMLGMAVPRTPAAASPIQSAPVSSAPRSAPPVRSITPPVMASQRAPGERERAPETSRPPSTPNDRVGAMAQRAPNANPLVIPTRTPIVSEVDDPSRRSPTLRPQMTRRWDPRSEDESAEAHARSAGADAPSGRAGAANAPAASRREPAPTLQSASHEKTPVSGAMPRREMPASTRQVNWDTFGKERLSSTPPVNAKEATPIPGSGADDILAAYLSEVESIASNPPSREFSMPMSRGSGGLRWGEPRSSHGEHRASQVGGDARASRSGEPRSSQGERGSRQGGERRSSHGQPPSSQGHASSTPSSKVGPGPANTQAPASGEIESTRKTAPPPSAPAPSDRPSGAEPSPQSIAGPTSGRAKAGNQGWGAPRRDRK